FDIKNDLTEKAKAELQFPDTNPNKRVLPPLTRLIEAGAETPALFTLPRGSYTDLVMTFPLINAKGDLTTNWPLQPSFPLFMRNVLYHLGNVGDTLGADSVQPGEPMVLRPEAGVKWLQVTSPKGETVKLSKSQRADFTFGGTEHLGVYQVVRD